MTPKQKSLPFLYVAIFLSSTLLGNSSPLQAQGANNIPSRIFPEMKAARVPLTRDEAAKKFVGLLNFFAPLSGFTDNPATDFLLPPPPMRDALKGLGTPDAAMLSSFSRQSENDGSILLLDQMVFQYHQPIQKVRVEQQDTNNATATVETLPDSVKRSFVLVQEGESWGVDIYATYALWNGLDNSARAATLAPLARQVLTIQQNLNDYYCQDNLKHIAYAMRQYARDHDGKLPPSNGWMDALLPYTKSQAVFHCPAVEEGRGYGYAYNSKLAGKPLSSFPKKTSVMVIYETADLKRDASSQGEKRAYRHHDGSLESSNYALINGQVKALNKIKSSNLSHKPSAISPSSGKK